jgi:hypothetical protein
MTTIISRLIITMSLVVFGATAGLAQSNCKPEVNATGSAALTQKGAEDRAISNWRRAVVLRYGEVFATYDRAEGRSVGRCGKTILGLTRCEATGRPCEVAVATDGTGGPEIACVAKKDSKNCDPFVKWVQSRLNAKLGSNLKVDGAAGKQTQDSLRRFQRQNNLGTSGELDDKTIAALR